MGVIAGVAALIAEAVSGVIAAVSAVLATVTTAIVAAVSSIAIATAAIVGELVAAVVGAVSQTTVVIGNSISGVVTEVVTAVAKTAKPIYAYIKSIASTFKALLQAIHFDVIVQVHSLAYLISEDYRLMMDKVWGEIAKFADAIAAPAGYIENAIQIARSSVLNVSGFLGKRYDLAQVSWLTDFQSLLGRINETGELYRDNPSRIWYDIDELITKPAIDTKAEAQQGFITTIRGTVTAINKTIETIDEYRNDINNAISKLPKKWRYDIQAKTGEIWDRFDRWRTDIYWRSAAKINQVIAIISGEQTSNKKQLQELSHRIARGGDLLAEIDKLPEQERKEQESKVADIATRKVKSRADDFIEATDTGMDELLLIQKAAGLKLPPELWQIPEKAGLTSPIGKQSKDIKSWFVGDY